MKTAREVLDAIDQFLVEGNIDETRKLWDVLSALRGPDSESQELKHYYTIPIRRAAFPEYAKRYDEGGIVKKMWAAFGTRNFNSSLSGIGDKHGHFAHHIRAAANALNMPF